MSQEDRMSRTGMRGAGCEMRHANVLWVLGESSRQQSSSPPRRLQRGGMATQQLTRLVESTCSPFSSPSGCFQLHDDLMIAHKDDERSFGLKEHLICSECYFFPSVVSVYTECNQAHPFGGKANRGHGQRDDGAAIVAIALGLISRSSLCEWRSRQKVVTRFPSRNITNTHSSLSACTLPCSLLPICLPQ